MNQDVSATSSQGGFADSSAVAETASGTDVRSAVAEMASGTDARNLYITPSLRSGVISPPVGWIYWMSWDTITVGDCRMEGARLYLYPDGMIFFLASTFSSSSGDVWLIKGIQFLDRPGGNPIGHPIPQHDGMNMAWEGSEYPFVFWDAIPGVTPTGVAQIRSALMYSHC
jgi:hypothetical protein